MSKENNLVDSIDSILESGRNKTSKLEDIEIETQRKRLNKYNFSD